MQLIKKIYFKDLICEFFNKISVKNNNFYIINNYTFKKSQIDNNLQNFLEELKKYYYKSKTFYLTREIKYNNFLTIIRHICNHHDIKYETKVSYIKSIYNIEYYIYID